MTRTNHFDQPIGDDLDGWTPPLFHPHTEIVGTYVTLEPLTVRDHAEEFVAAFDDAPDSLWTYLPWLPVRHRKDAEALIGWLDEQPDWLSYAVRVSETMTGILSYLRIDPPNGVTEIGGIVFNEDMQRTKESTESIHLLIEKAFDEGYRRVEWKCDDKNLPSRAAAERFGMRYEGTFRQATHYHGRNRDTAWFSLLDTEWPVAGAAFNAWLAAENFDAVGTQRRTLRDLRSELATHS
jgi:RimJ/RimL family protein N-acetyltransferase